MEFRILGPMEVLDGARRVELPAGRARALLAILVLHAGDRVATDRLIDELWGEQPPATVTTVVQILVSKLRKALEPEREKAAKPTVLLTEGAGYRLAVPPESVDAGRFRRLVGAATGRPAQAGAALLGEALALWRGPALADFSFEPFAQRTIAALEELRLGAVESRIEADLEVGRDRAVVHELEQLVAEHPFRARLRCLQMLAFYRAGRQADALDAYRGARAQLVEELGIEPGPELRDLEAAILRQDPSLSLPSPASGDAATGIAGWLPRERRTVTVVALDLSPQADGDVDPEALARAGAPATEAAAVVLDRYGARVEHLVGELLVAFFGFPVAHEDDALRPVRAAAQARAAVEALDQDSTLHGIRHGCRAAVETGDVVASSSGGSLADMVSGQAVSAAHRLQRLAGTGDVVLGPATWRLVRGAVVAESIPGADGAVLGWRLLGIVPGATPVRRQFEAPLLGRDEELARLRRSFRRAVREGSPVRCTVIGEAGIGKSRLVKDFVDTLEGGTRVLTGACQAYGDGITLLPLREALGHLVDGPSALAELVAAEDAAEIGAALGWAEGSGNMHALMSAVAARAGRHSCSAASPSATAG